MATRERASMADIVGRDEEQLLPEWIQHQLASTTLRRDLLSEEDLHAQSRRFLGAFRKVLANGGAEQDISTPAWEETRELLGDIAQARARQGFSPSETATFVFSLKQPLFDRLRAELGGDPAALAEAMLEDRHPAPRQPRPLHHRGRTRRAARRSSLRQQQEMLELSTPVVKLWDGILALPLIGTLDSARTQVVMETPAAADRRHRRRPSRSSTSPACRRSTRWSRSTC